MSLREAVKTNFSVANQAKHLSIQSLEMQTTIPLRAIEL